MTAYYSENDSDAAAWLRELMREKWIAPGDVDTRSIKDVRPSDLAGYTQCHFFAGIGGWSYALRLAGWPDERPVWTGSCPCQPFSLAGKQKGFDDERHLWPVFRELIRLGSPPIVFGEQVASASEWLGLVRSELEAVGYAVGAMPIQAASAGADHLRDRYWFVADSDRDPSSARRGDAGEVRCVPEAQRQWEHGPAVPCGSGRAIDVANGEVIADPRQWIREKPQRLDNANFERRDGCSEFSWVIGSDGKARRVKSGIRLLADGFPSRVGLLRGFGNAIDPRPAAAFIKAADEAMRML